MLTTLAFGTIPGVLPLGALLWALLVFLLLLAQAPEKTMAEIIRDAKSSR